jgi:hypothetical protein
VIPLADRKSTNIALNNDGSDSDAVIGEVDGANWSFNPPPSPSVNPMGLAISIAVLLTVLLMFGYFRLF